MGPGAHMHMHMHNRTPLLWAGQAVCNRVGNLLGAGRGADARFSAAVAWLMAAGSAGCVGAPSKQL